MTHLYMNKEQQNWSTSLLHEKLIHTKKEIHSLKKKKKSLHIKARESTRDWKINISGLAIQDELPTEAR